MQNKGLTDFYIIEHKAKLPVKILYQGKKFILDKNKSTSDSYYFYNSKYEEVIDIKKWIFDAYAWS